MSISWKTALFKTDVRVRAIPFFSHSILEPHTVPGARHVTSSGKMQLESSIKEVPWENNPKQQKQLSIAQVSTSESSNLELTRLQPASSDDHGMISWNFGDFMSREAVTDEEYWTAAWLRAESHWEHQANDRYVLNYKRKFAEQEYNALKRRCKDGYLDHKCLCIVTVNKVDRNVTPSASETVLGTLDLSIRHFLRGESYPGEKTDMSHLLSNIEKNNKDSGRYGYIANLCVAKTARRKGIATNMLLFAVKYAQLRGADQVYVHVDRDSVTAHQLYQKLGFQIVTDASDRLLEEKTYLLCCNI